MCTVFKFNIKNERGFIVGKNYDLPDPCYGMIFTNLRQVNKTALIMEPDIPMRWTAIFGSVTFSQVSKEFPSCGINEAGLIVEQTTLWNTVYPDRDSRLAVKELQWIQYMLDTCKTVDEVIQKLENVRVAQENAKIQYFVCDATGEVALIEYILGEEVVFRKESLPYPVIANDMYATSLDYLKIHRGYGGKKEMKPTSLSIDRFAVTVQEIRSKEAEAGKDDEISVGFNILNKSAFELTQWQIVYQPQNLIVGYCSKNSSNIKKINLKSFDFSSSEQSLVKSIDAVEVEKFTAYSTEINYNLAKSFFESSPLTKGLKISEELLVGFSRYPEKQTKIFT